MKKAILFASALIPLFVGCGSKSSGSSRPSKTFANLEIGEKVYFTNDNAKTYFVIKNSAKQSTNSSGYITKITFSIQTIGYSTLSYFQAKLECTYSYTFLGDDGDMHDSTQIVSLNPNGLGDSKQTVSISVNYRSTNNFRITNFDCEGFAVRIK